MVFMSASNPQIVVKVVLAVPPRPTVDHPSATSGAVSKVLVPVPVGVTEMTAWELMVKPARAAAVRARSPVLIFIRSVGIVITFLDQEPHSSLHKEGEP